MEARAVTGLDDLRPGAYGIPEPVEVCPVIEREKIDLILAPNLCCDRLATAWAMARAIMTVTWAGYAGVTVALCPEEWLQEELPRDEFDLPVRLMLTQTQVRRGAEAPRRTPEESAAK